ncbi:helix-turn-helix transcriptional regulator [Desulfovibrio sp. TomC]|uniref:helix-turn-helix transcriptional regulator n=1 Tax=Desulfovibrio sp. TomC TaxID=1562888 RepID=UPI0012E1BB8E|nr:WYL domain-containing protein [Desulfovibrio sp. TomC]
MPVRLNSDASSSSKMLDLYSLLVFSARKHTLSSLASRLRCSKATIMRFITDIELVEVIETGKDGKERWYKINKLANMRNKIFTHEDIQQLVLCKDILFSLLPDDMRIELGKTVEGTAEFLVDKSVREYALTPIAQSRVKGFIDYTPFQQEISKIMQAIPKKRICTVVYHSAKSQQTREFTVAPMRLVAYHESLYVECWRIKEQDGQEIVQPMTLAVQRIKNFNPLAKKHKFTEYPSDESNLFGLMNKKALRLRVHFDASVSQYVSERQWSKDQVISLGTDGSVDLVFTANNKEECFSWLLSFGIFAEIVEPLDLRCEFANRLIVLKNKYCLGPGVD